MRKLFAHAFSETALLEQASLLTGYFDLLVCNLKRQIDGPKRGRVDIMAYYNFTTFDIIGDIMQAIKFFGFIKTSAKYAVLRYALKLLEAVVPSIAESRARHFEFTKTRIEKRLEMETTRTDIMAYASPILLHPCLRNGRGVITA
ncbi:MAG: hypothetical protein Q9168_008100 [Polycauliona sp. 1 TL-2023]